VHHDHNHEHPHAHHQTAQERDFYLYLKAFGLAVLAVILEFYVSINISGSVALLSDALHGASDGLTYGGFALAAGATFFWPGKERGFKIFAVLLSFTLLFIGDYYVFREAVDRIFLPREILGWTTFFTAIVSMGLNGAVMFMLRDISDEERDICHDSVSFHAISDFLASLGVIISAMIVALTGWNAVDWIIALVIAFYLLFLLCVLGVRISRGEWNIGHEHGDGH